MLLNGAGARCVAGRTSDFMLARNVVMCLICGFVGAFGTPESTTRNNDCWGPERPGSAIARSISARRADKANFCPIPGPQPLISLRVGPCESLCSSDVPKRPKTTDIPCCSPQQRTPRSWKWPSWVAQVRPEVKNGAEHIAPKAALEGRGCTRIGVTGARFAKKAEASCLVFCIPSFSENAHPRDRHHTSNLIW